MYFRVLMLNKINTKVKKKLSMLNKNYTFIKAIFIEANKKNTNSLNTF